MIKSHNFHDFKLSCSKCYEIIYQATYYLEIDSKGKPLESEIKRVFSNKQFNVSKKCPCCSNNTFTKEISYNSDYSEMDHDNDNDLPF